MNEPINHHYLPVFYLRQWCNAAGKVVRYYRPDQKVVASPITPDKTGFERALYTLTGFPAEQQQSIEKSYMAPIVDEPASKVLQMMLENGANQRIRSEVTLTEQRRTDWARFLMSLELREPSALAKNHDHAVQNLTAKLVENPSEYEAIRGEGSPATLLEFVEKRAPHILQNLGKTWLPGFIENEKIGGLLVNMRWSTFDLIASNITLLTGDRPYLRYAGLKDPNCVIALPLSPRFLFVGTHTTERQQRILEGSATRIVREINSQIVSSAIKHVYGLSAGHLSFVESRLARIGVDRRTRGASNGAPARYD